VDALHWAGGLQWHGPMAAAPEDDEEDPAFEEALAALEAEALTLNVAVRQVERAAGLWHDDPQGVAVRLADRATQRFYREPFLACEHVDNLLYIHLWGGPLLGAACPESMCQQRLDHLIETSRRFGWCGLCLDRSPCLSAVTVAITPTSNGRLLTPAHDRCLYPDRPIGAAPTLR
jgi:hypothetical protein